MADVCPETQQKPQWILQNRIFTIQSEKVLATWIIQGRRERIMRTF